VPDATSPVDPTEPDPLDDWAELLGGRSGRRGRRRRPDGRDRRRRWPGFVLLALVVGAGAGAVAAWRLVHDPAVSPTVAATQVNRVSGSVTDAAVTPRTVEPYKGYGVWADAFDFSPAYAGSTPPVTPATTDAMAAGGARTLYLQAARLDPKSPTVLEDPWLLAGFVLRAHQHDLAVVGWFLPKWGGDGSDETRLAAIAHFSVLGQRFDGVAVDIEWIKDTTADERSARLVRVSQQIKQDLDGGPVGAIVMPPVVTEVLNTTFWPRFPWTELAPLYDAWLSMSYWSNRSAKSEWHDPYRYTTENVRRLRLDLKKPMALVHSVGGIGALDGVDDPKVTEEPYATIGELDGFAKGVVDSGSVGASLYDWNATEPAARTRLSALLRPLFPPKTT
jgi:hypothetical protein